MLELVVADVLWSLDVDECDARLAADRDGPNSAATAAERSIELDGASGDALGFASFVRFMNVLNSYFARMYFSSSLSRSDSIMFVGGGYRFSSGLYNALDLMFPVCFMCSTCSLVHVSSVRLFTFEMWVPIFRWILAQFTQIKMPRLCDAHLGVLALQSAHTSLPGWLTSSRSMRWFFSAASLLVPDIPRAISGF